MSFQAASSLRLFTIENYLHSSAPAILFLHILLSLFLGAYLGCFSGRSYANVQDMLQSYQSFGFITHSSWDRLLGPKEEKRGSIDKELE
jgi:hypothetical protein